MSSMVRHFGLGVVVLLAVPIIRELKSWLPTAPDALVIRDAPPGTSCPVVETVRDLAGA